MKMCCFLIVSRKIREITFSNEMWCEHVNKMNYFGETKQKKKKLRQTITIKPTFG